MLIDGPEKILIYSPGRHQVKLNHCKVKLNHFPNVNKMSPKMIPMAPKILFIRAHPQTLNFIA